VALFRRFAAAFDFLFARRQSGANQKPNAAP